MINYKERALNKAEAKIMAHSMHLAALEQETPYGSYTEEMIDGQKEHHERELSTWMLIKDSLLTRDNRDLEN